MAEEPKMCKNCAYYDLKNQECHRYAPGPVEQDSKKKIVWPSTPPIGWCGECRRIPKEEAQEEKKPAAAGVK